MTHKTDTISKTMAVDPQATGNVPVDLSTRRARYALMTAAYNEEANIAKTIESILSQTHLPERWVIVSDGSVDRTDEIIQQFAEQYSFIRFLRVTRPPGRSFGSKVLALKSGAKLLDGADFDFIGNVDADISVDRSYFVNLIEHFQADRKLGIASGFVKDKNEEGYETNKTNRVHSVAHGAQLVRRECYEAIGGYTVLEYGGEDWHAHVSAMMRGWEAKAFPDIHMLHERPTGSADNLLRHRFREGRMDYTLGSDPSFEIFKCFERMSHKPFLRGGMARLAGFTWSWMSRDRRPVSKEFVDFLRKDQRARLKSLFSFKVKSEDE